MSYVFANLHYFLAMISTIVVCHELGHFIVAKFCGVQVSRFSVGFGPVLLSVTYGETVYQIGLLPLGGYVKMLGDMPDAEVPPEAAARAFCNRPVWQRTAIVLAGPMANMVLAFAVYLSMSLGTHQVAATRLGLVAPGDAADAAGLRAGDRIVAVDGQPMAAWGDLREAIGSRPNQLLEVAYERSAAAGAERRVAKVQAGARAEANAFGEPVQRGKIGISSAFVRPIVAVVDPDSPAARAGLRSGDRILRLGKAPLTTWHELREQLAAWPNLEVPLEVRSPDGTPRQVQLTARPGALGPGDSLLSAANLPAAYTGLVSQDSVVSEVAPDGAAHRAGVQVGDRILALRIAGPGGQMERRPVHVWEIDLASFGLGQLSDLTVEVQRGAAVLQLPLHLSAPAADDTLQGSQIELSFGASNPEGMLENYTVERQTGLWQAGGLAFEAVCSDAQTISRGLVRLARRSLPLSTVGGPIMLFVMAERSAKLGLLYYLNTMAVLSVNVGLINLLPIPVLDGGHLSFFFLEAISGRPPSPRLRMVAQAVGLVLLLGLMLFTLGHDAWRFMF